MYQANELTIIEGQFVSVLVCVQVYWSVGVCLCAPNVPHVADCYCGPISLYMCVCLISMKTFYVNALRRSCKILSVANVIATEKFPCKFLVQS